MTDDQMDARLHAAGERWRTAHDNVATVDPAAATTPVVEPVAPRPPRRHWTLLASAAVVTAAIVIGGTIVLHGSGNGTGPSSDTSPLENTVWLLTGRPGTTSNATLRIADGQLVADDDCRIVTGTADVSSDTLTISDQVVRYKDCVDQYGPGIYEQGTKVLEGSSTYAITADGLTISKDGAELDFTPAPEAVAAPTADYPTFLDTPWLLVSAKDTHGDQVTVAGDPTVRFGTDGKLSGSDGCNSLSGTFTGQTHQTTFGDVGGSEVFCPGDAGATENVVLAVMSGKVGVAVSGGRLTLSKGQAELVYRWNPDPSANNDPQSLLGVEWTLVDGGGYGLADKTTLTIQQGDPAWDVTRGLLTAVHPSSDALGKLLGSYSHVWSIEDGRLRIVLDDVQGRALVFGSESTLDDIPLVGTDWVLMSASDGSTTHDASANQSLTITGDQLQASDGVNTLGGSVAIGDHVLTLSNVSTTDIGSIDDDPARDLIDAVLTEGDVDYTLEGITLTLTRGANVLTYQAHRVVHAAGIEGSWDLATIETGTGPDGTASTPSRAVTLQFDGTTVHLVGSCTLLSAYTTTGTTLSTEGWGPFQTNTSACSDVGLTSDEIRVVFGTLGSGSTYAIDGDTLTITKDGVGAVVLTHAT